MISFKFSDHCCGCGACADACPKKCISIVNDSFGVRIPKIDVASCVGCGKCEVVCPVLNVFRVRFENRQLYCAFNKDEQDREKGSSGSVFFALAQYVISKRGIVYGAGFDGNLKLRHTKAENELDLAALCKSKYLQSDTTGCFSDVKKQLNEGKTVLFVGTPCQCQALRNFVGLQNAKDLILTDLICHGVPGQELFDKYIHSYEIKNKCKVLSFSFRIKKNYGEENVDMNHYRICYQTGSGELKEEISPYMNSSFYSGFKKYYPFRKSCYECRFVGSDRVSDLTIGDFWNLEKIDNSVKDFYKGYSMVVVNSEKGKTVLKGIQEKVELRPMDNSLLLHNNEAYRKPTTKNAIQYVFRWCYTFMPYDLLEKIFFENDHPKLRMFLRKSGRKVASLLKL